MSKKVDITKNCRILFIISIIIAVHTYCTTELMQSTMWIIAMSLNAALGLFLFWGGRIYIPATHKLFFYFVSLTFTIMGPVIIMYSIFKTRLIDDIK